MKQGIKKLIIILIMSLFLGNTGYCYDSEEMININVYEAVNPAIVAIDCILPDGLSSGTGCLISTDGMIITSSHVVGGSTKIDVTTSNGQIYKGEIVNKLKNKNDDLTLIKIKGKEPFATVKLGDSEKIKVGQKVLAIGNPFGFNGTLTQGIISRIDYSKNKIQTDAAINPGNSGGPLINTTGEVIGISQSIYNPDSNISNIGIGFAVPINSVKELVSNEKKSAKK